MKAYLKLYILPDRVLFSAITEKTHILDLNVWSPHVRITLEEREALKELATRILISRGYEVSEYD